MNEDGDDSGKWCSEQEHNDIINGDDSGNDVVNKDMMIL